MGRPPSPHALSNATRQRLWRARRKAAHAPPPPAEPSPVPAPEIEPAPAPPPPAPVQTDAELIAERDHAVREQGRLRLELQEVVERLDVALRGAVPQPVVIGDRLRLAWCTSCRRRWGEAAHLPPSQVEMMFQLGPAGPFICGECIARFGAMIEEAG